VAEGKAVFHNRSILDKASLNTSKKLENEFSPLAQPPKCPQCSSQRTYRDGLRYLTDGTTIQRWLCRECSYRFTEKKPLQKKPNCQINTASALLSKRQVCELLTEESKNLAIVPRQEPASREGTQQTADTKGKIIEFLWHLKKEAYSPTTIEVYGKRLLQLADNCDILDPEKVKEFVANRETWNNSTKLLTVATYKTFADFVGIPFKPPRYQPQEKIPFIPTEKELDDLIAGCAKKKATLLQLLKETGMRIGEARRLRWIDIDIENSLITLNNTEKNGKPRAFKISQKLTAMLNAIPKEKNGPFKSCYTNLYRDFNSQRRTIAAKLQNPRLLRITFHTFRHWKATMEYHKTKDILHVMQLLGHRNIKNTLIYTQLINFENDDYHSATAKTIEDATKLIETGFEYVCTHDNIILFRKPK
jgi:integrase